MRPIISLVLLCALYGLGISASLYGTELSPLEKHGALGLALLVSLVVYYWRFYRPLVRLQHSYLKILFDHLFDALIKKYKQQKPGDYELRVNIMRLRRKYLIGPRFMRIDFYSSGHTEAEKEQEYRVNVGCCGTAIEDNTQIFFDAREAQEPYKGMTPTQRQVTSHVKSILSTPLYRAGDDAKVIPIAALNIDSASAIAETGFNDRDLQELAAKYAELVGALLP